MRDGTLPPRRRRVAQLGAALTTEQTVFEMLDKNAEEAARRVAATSPQPTA
jgi:hypothetical protein